MEDDVHGNWMRSAGILEAACITAIGGRARVRARYCVVDGASVRPPQVGSVRRGRSLARSPRASSSTYGKISKTTVAAMIGST
jgi:hypothetical protein